MRAVDPDGPRPPHIKPVHWAYLRACIRLIEAGKPVIQINLARELHISPQAVWKFLRRYPDVMTWVDDELRASNAKYYGLVQRRMAVLGMQGSPQHAEIYFKSDAGHYARIVPGSIDGVPMLPGGGAFTLNLLVPRPDSPGLVVASAPVPPTGSSPSQLIPRPPAPAAIPTVHVR